MEEETKVCKTCNQEKPLSQFYADKKAKDGHFNECKECTKQRVMERYYLNMQDEAFVEKERARGRKKYRERGYVHKPTAAKIQKQMKYTSLRNGIRDTTNAYSKKGMELHHWNYRDNKYLIALDKRLHHRLHKLIVLDMDSGLYYMNGSPLDTIDKHLEAVKFICERDGFDFSNVVVISRN